MLRAASADDEDNISGEMGAPLLLHEEQGARVLLLVVWSLSGKMEAEDPRAALLEVVEAFVEALQPSSLRASL